MKRLAVGLAFLVCVSCRPSYGEVDGHTVRRTIRVGEVERTYYLHVPPSYSRQRGAALIVCLHGGGSTARQMERFTKFSGLSDREGFLVAYPQSVNRNWNDGRVGSSFPKGHEDIDDVGFLKAMIRKIEKEYSIDPKRIFATGASNGGFMSHRLAAEFSEKIAAIAPVIGGMSPRVARGFKPAKPVSVLIIQGTEDPLVPFGGGPITLFFGQKNRGRSLDTRETVRKWVEHNRCDRKPELRELPDKDPKDGTRTKVESYGRGASRTEVLLYVVVDGGHTWPGAAQYLRERLIGKTSRDFDATRAIWRFFKSHPRP